MADGFLAFEFEIVLHVIQIQADAGQLSEKKEVFGSSTPWFSGEPCFYYNISLVQIPLAHIRWSPHEGKKWSPPPPPQTPRAKNDSAWPLNCRGVNCLCPYYSGVKYAPYSVYKVGITSSWAEDSFTTMYVLIVYLKVCPKVNILYTVEFTWDKIQTFPH